MHLTLKGGIGLALAAWIVALLVLVEPLAHAQESVLPGISGPSPSLLAGSLLVTWYGNPRTGLMGVLGKYEGGDRVTGLAKQAAAFSQLTGKKVIPAYQLIAVVAMDSPGSDNMWRRRETTEVIDAMLSEARQNGFKLILDVQVGQSTVAQELASLRPYLELPDVYLALDPEFDMWKGQEPGKQIGHTESAEVNFAIALLEGIIWEKRLPPKVLIVHQFTLNMLPDKENVRRDTPTVDVVLDMDGFGEQAVKLSSYRTVMGQPLEYAGVKLFYEHDPDLLSPERVMQLDPVPSVVIYQ